MAEISGLYVDKASPVPLYEQLRQAVLKAIKSGKIKEGGKLPTEEELCGQLGVSRPVVRQAYNSLITDGYVKRMRGKGTFVDSADTRGRFIDSQFSFSKEMTILGKSHFTEMLHREWLTGNREAMDMLELDKNERCYYLKRIRYVEEKPYVLVENYIPEAVFPGIDKYDFGEKSLFGVYEKEYGVRIVRAQRVIHARLANSEFAKLFGVAPGSPVFYITNVSIDQNNRLVDYSIEYLDGQVQKFEFDVINQ